MEVCGCSPPPWNIEALVEEMLWGTTIVSANSVTSVNSFTELDLSQYSRPLHRLLSLKVLPSLVHCILHWDALQTGG